ncbi:hypothetical protein [Singulisphaera acidiphila]|uniref:Acetyltransferase n=1 Tax=Singulisphaera acidiphila (strain ATCC BAA-1392 / DSM 18658 / VKM B-2454 / MOB10) TaxID=886293 RepID=L0DEQ7_SINAD|nr:hypothetical protein [Singulisphaera acidiphila]AGA27854.1 hypothetical protein Sinac_3604 [Singulisphaera acidiphila DSM 18658]
MKNRDLRLAEEIRSACLRAALEAYEDGGLRGLCAEGRWEYALEAIRSLALVPLLKPDEPEGGQGRTSLAEEAYAGDFMTQGE